MTTPLTVTRIQRPDGTVRLAATGEIDMSNAATLAEALRESTGALVLDLAEVGYLDSAGLNVLFTFADRIEIVANPVLVPVLTISGLAALAPVTTVDPPSSSDSP